MDSLTQIVLGASVGEAVAGRRLGNKALLWGAVAGTIPDLDVLASPWLDPVQQLSFHRSVTHSFLFALVMSPLLAWLMQRLYKHAAATFRDWSLLFFLGFVTHALLDSCTTWGTQLFWPFSTYGVAFYNVFVVDPLYTLPFLLLVGATLFYKRNSPKRRFFNYAGLAVSSAYLLWSFVAKSMADRVFEQSMAQQSVGYTSFISKPTPMNTIFWSVTAKDDKGFYNGFYSLLDQDKNISYTFEPQNASLLAPYRRNAKLERLLEITKGYYTVAKADDGSLLIHDLRFGRYDGWQDSGGHFVFVYKLWQDEQGALHFKEINNRPNVDKAYLLRYWERITGKK
ncbi:metal-dependent hydrolase [Pontibacter mangrovi]|uniref:Metal-dependent hydrolase n=1 Tax=Pontibacter mangrovi TaxID=2589816 RepID=A0A501WCQ5_9BACT|nr:metal-dependent hydrolase [Pontibacter mangrovi]TPE45864.1 metal-dependent hydrolase [Pontibacter mangrovi]